MPGLPQLPETNMAETSAAAVVTPNTTQMANAIRALAMDAV